MRHILCAICLVVLAACASAPQPHVALPEETPFDDNLAAQKAYLGAYRDGYLAGASGQYYLVCTFGRGGLVGFAKEAGWMDGQYAAKEDRHEQMRKEMEARRQQQK